jgi:hypothetical protein
MPLIWIHEDCLSLDHPGYAKYPDAPSLFVFDEAEFAAEQRSLKRIGFVYECLLDLPAVIQRGDPAERVAAFARAQGLRHIVTTPSPSPRIRAAARTLASGFELELLEPAPFVDYRGKLDLKRFSRYWQRVQAHAFGG